MIRTVEAVIDPQECPPPEDIQLPEPRRALVMILEDPAESTRPRFVSERALATDVEFVLRRMQRGRTYNRRGSACAVSVLEPLPGQVAPRIVLATPPGATGSCAR